MSASPVHEGSESVLERIRSAQVVPVVRTTDPQAARRTVDRLVDAGLDVIEVTTSVPGWDDIVGELREQEPQVCVGAGTVTGAALAARAREAGAAFCVSPCLAPQARETLARSAVPLIEGGLTPTEVLGAAHHGVAKLFPAHVGGLAYLRSLLAVQPTARIMPTGGIGLDDVRSWLDAGAFAVGVGSDLSAAGDVAARVRRVLEP